MFIGSLCLNFKIWENKCKKWDHNVIKYFFYIIIIKESPVGVFSLISYYNSPTSPYEGGRMWGHIFILAEVPGVELKNRHLEINKIFFQKSFKLLGQKANIYI